MSCTDKYCNAQPGWHYRLTTLACWAASYKSGWVALSNSGSLQKLQSTTSGCWAKEALLSFIATHQRLHSLLADGILVRVHATHRAGRVPENEAAEHVQKRIQSACDDGQGPAGN